jgi:hypothetical protein
MQQLNTYKGRLRRLKRCEPQQGPCDPFHPTMILLDDVVEILALADFNRRAVLMVVALDGGFIGLTAINRDLLRDAMTADAFVRTRMAVLRVITKRLRELMARSSSTPSELSARCSPGPEPVVKIRVSMISTGNSCATRCAYFICERSAAIKRRRSTPWSRKVRPTTTTSSSFAANRRASARPIRFVPPIMATCLPRRAPGL